MLQRSSRVTTPGVAHGHGSCFACLFECQHVELNLLTCSRKEDRPIEDPVDQPAAHSHHGPCQRKRPQHPGQMGVDGGQSTPQQQRNAAPENGQHQTANADGAEQRLVSHIAQKQARFFGNQICIALNMHRDEFRSQQQFEQDLEHQREREPNHQLSSAPAVAPTPAAISTDLKGSFWM